MLDDVLLSKLFYFFVIFYKLQVRDLCGNSCLDLGIRRVIGTTGYHFFYVFYKTVARVTKARAKWRE